MKKISKLIFTFSFILLSSCNNTPSDISSSSNSSSNISSDITSDSSSNISSDISNDSSSSGTTSGNEEEILTLLIDRNTIDDNYFGKYETGNSLNETEEQYKSVDGIKFSYYCALTEYEYLLSLKPYIVSNEDGTLEGSFSNIDSFGLIKSINITYKTETLNSSLDGIALYYGNSYPLNEYQVDNCTSAFKTVSFDVDNSLYFRIEARNEKLTIDNILINYVEKEKNQFEKVNLDNQYRISPIRYKEDTKISGESYVNVPTSISIDNGKYIVEEYTKLTYYSIDSVYDGKVSAKEASVTDPFLVASYYFAFNEFPINYNSRLDTNTFGEYARRCSKTYTRDDGYVLAFPQIKDNPDFYALGYVELDIELIGQNYVRDGRGTARLVIFYSGSNEDSYNNDAFIVYTDDHYATFKEYLGYGFGDRFDGQNSRTGYKWCPSITLTN